jgi:hypothetical protein
MISKLSRQATVGALSAVLMIVAGISRADVTIQNTIAVEGVGMMAVGNMSGTTTTTISGDKSRTDSDIQMKSRLVRMLAHNAVGPSAQIVRLDEDKIYHLNINKKEYTAVTFEQMRDQLKKASDKMSAGEQRQPPSAIDESKCEWLPPKADVKKTGEKMQVAGYEAERVTITASQPCKDKETGSICEVALGLDEWLSAGFTESPEVQKYHKAYAAKMGLDASGVQDVSQRAKAMFGRYQGIWTQIAAKMQGTKGYPVKSSFTLALGGEQCQKTKQAQSSDSSGDSSGAGMDQIAGKLGSLFHKKKDDSDSTAAPSSQAPLPPGDVALMTISSQLISVSAGTAAPGTFEVPADFKKQETKTQ